LVKIATWVIIVTDVGIKSMQIYSPIIHFTKEEKHKAYFIKNFAFPMFFIETGDRNLAF